MPVGAGDRLIGRALSVCQLPDSVAKTGNYRCVGAFFPLPRTKVILKWGWFLLELFEGGKRVGATLRWTPAECGLLDGTDE